LGETSADVMNHLLNLEIDSHNMNVIKNTINDRDAVGINDRSEKRENYMIKSGYLYPAKFQEL